VGTPPTNAASIMKKHYRNLLQPFAAFLAPLVAENAGGNEDVANEKDTVTAKNEEDGAEDEANAADDDDADDEDYAPEEPVARHKSGVAAACFSKKLYIEVRKLGGYRIVTDQKLWRTVFRSLNLSLKLKYAGLKTKKFYEECFLPSEEAELARLPVAASGSVHPASVEPSASHEPDRLDEARLDYLTAAAVEDAAAANAATADVAAAANEALEQDDNPIVTFAAHDDDHDETGDEGEEDDVRDADWRVSDEEDTMGDESDGGFEVGFGQGDVNSPTLPNSPANPPVYTRRSSRSAGGNLSRGGVPSMTYIEGSNNTLRAAAAPAFAAAAPVPASSAIAGAIHAAAFTPAPVASPPLPRRMLKRTPPSLSSAYTPTSAVGAPCGGGTSEANASPLESAAQGDGSASSARMQGDVGAVPVVNCFVQQQPITYPSVGGGAAALPPSAEQQGAATNAPVPLTPTALEDMQRECERERSEWAKHGEALEKKEAEVQRQVREARAAAEKAAAEKVAAAEAAEAAAQQNRAREVAEAARAAKCQAIELVVSSKRALAVADVNIAESKRRKVCWSRQIAVLVDEQGKEDRKLEAYNAVREKVSKEVVAASEALDALP